MLQIPEHAMTQALGAEIQCGYTEACNYFLHAAEASASQHMQQERRLILLLRCEIM